MNITMAFPENFESLRLCFQGSERVVYRTGKGPAVVLLQELPNQTPQYFNLAQRIADHGFTVWCPHLFGVPGAPFSTLNAGRKILRFCISREFKVFSQRQSSPIVDWIRDLCKMIGEKTGVGVIGMCFTGNFALALIDDPHIKAPVLSQPSLPYGLTPALRKATHVEPFTLQNPHQTDVLALRFSNDPLCPRSRFSQLKATLGDRFTSLELNSSFGNPHRIQPLAHAVLTIDAVFEGEHPTNLALEKVLQFLDVKLKTESEHEKKST